MRWVVKRRDREKSHADDLDQKSRSASTSTSVDSESEQGESPRRAKEIAARTVNKERAQKGQTDDRVALRRPTTCPRHAVAACARGRLRAKGRTKAQLYNEAKQRGIKGRSIDDQGPAAAAPSAPRGRSSPPLRRAPR